MKTCHLRGRYHNEEHSTGEMSEKSRGFSNQFHWSEINEPLHACARNDLVAQKDLFKVGE